MSTEKTKIDFINFFGEEAKTIELDGGIHERVKLVSIQSDERVDNHDNPSMKQLFLLFKKFDEKNNDVGQLEVSFFKVDAAKDTAVSNLLGFISQVKEILSTAYSSEELEEKFDPIKVLFEDVDFESIDEDKESEIKESVLFKNIKKTIKKASNYAKIEKQVREQFHDLMEEYSGFDSSFLRLKVVKNKKNYSEIPRYESFIEKASVSKKDSILTA